MPWDLEGPSRQISDCPCALTAWQVVGTKLLLLMMMMKGVRSVKNVTRETNRVVSGGVRVVAA